MRIDGFTGVGAFIVLFVLLFIAYKVGQRGGVPGMGG
jgi:hypothetical protein